MRVALIGTGYVGLVSGAGLAEAGHDVVCVDADRTKVDIIAGGVIPIVEVGLSELVARHLGSRLKVTTDLSGAVAAADLAMICVGTPSLTDGSIDDSAVRTAASQIGAALPSDGRWRDVVVKSTVVPGTTDSVVVPTLEAASGRRAGLDFGVAVNPEFLTEGQAVEDFLRPDRIVLGAEGRTLEALRLLYEPFGDAPVLVTNRRTAEMVKYASNALLATAISFANEIANLGAAIGGIDAVDVMRGVHLSRYLTPTAGGPVELCAFLSAGCGYGGSCLPKDLAALSVCGAVHGEPLRLLDAVAAVNHDQPARLVALARRRLGTLSGRSITVLGLAFKPDTDDVRCSPAFPVIRGLQAEGAVVTVHDPVVGPEAVAEFGPDGPAHVADLAVALKGAEAVLLVTRWAEYRQLPELLEGHDPPPLVVDGRRLLRSDSVTRYAAIGL